MQENCAPSADVKAILRAIDRMAWLWISAAAAWAATGAVVYFAGTGTILGAFMPLVAVALCFVAARHTSRVRQLVAER